jgi:hypothetical protein
MKIIIIIIFISLFFSQNIFGQLVTSSDASMIAENWIKIIIDKKGTWSGSQSASIKSVNDFKYKQRSIGYICDISPNGYIIVSLRRELSPVKAYSSISKLDPTSERGISQIVKTSMFAFLDKIESQIGPLESAISSEIASLTRNDYLKIWNFIENYQPGTFRSQQTNNERNYLEGEVLLTSRWHQRQPYNNNCPFLGCTDPTNGRAYVGCVATASAQIMKYWSWPPFGETAAPYTDTYDWPNMQDNVTTGSPAAEQAAVAELCAEIGQAVDMDYGCDGSGVPTRDMHGVFENIYRYSTMCNVIDYRSDYTAQDWWDEIKHQLNLNRPILYRIFNAVDTTGHAIVCDGWQEITPTWWQYHMNYGWNDGNTTWYDFDDLLISTDDDDYMVLNIVPDVLLSLNLSGTYSVQSFNYRYFDRDASGTSAVFSAGQFLQALPGITITGNGTSTYISFLGSTVSPTQIYTNGDPSEGVAIINGAIRLSNGGSIKLQ